MTAIAERLAQVRARIDGAARRASRDPEEVRLVAVSKGQPAEAIREAHAAGQRLFGENYAQELRDKAGLLADLPDLSFHFIGRLQKNKARIVAPIASMVEALDGLPLAQELDRRASVAGRVLPVLIEVNLGEAQKGGVAPDQLDALAARLARLSALRLEGLMCIPPPAPDPESVRPHFAQVAKLARELGLGTVSMGMSADFETAIEEGATLVRVGTAIFGERARTV